MSHIPERELAASVLLQALIDLERAPLRSVEYREAKTFSLAGVGGWATRRRFWCELLDVDEERFQRRAREIVREPSWRRWAWRKSRAKQPPQDTRVASLTQTSGPPFPPGETRSLELRLELRIA